MAYILEIEVYNHATQNDIQAYLISLHESVFQDYNST
jgi:hypothetical protein